MSTPDYKHEMLPDCPHRPYCHDTWDPCLKAMQEPRRTVDARTDTAQHEFWRPIVLGPNWVFQGWGSKHAWEMRCECGKGHGRDYQSHVETVELLQRIRARLEEWAEPHEREALLMLFDEEVAK